MTIASQLPQAVSGVRVSALQALGLQAGQVVDATVIGAAPNGGTQVQINGQLLNLVLPTLVAAGATLRFEVQGSGAHVKLALQVPAGQTNTATASPLPLPPGAAAPLILPSVAGGLPTATPGSPAPAAGVAAVPMPTGGLPSAPVAQPTSPAAAPIPSPVPPGAISQSTGSTSSVPAVPGPAMPAAGAPPVSTGGQAPVANPYMRAGTPQGQTATALPAAAQTGIGRVSAQVSSAATPPPNVPVTPQAALAQMVQAALPRQDGVSTLMAALTGLVGKVALPEPVLRAATQVLAGRIALDASTLNGSVLQKGVQNSGVFQEAMLARGQVPGDMKSALLGLQQVLSQWLGPQTALTPAGQIVPPLRGQTARAKAIDGPPIDPDAAPEEVGKQLLERTEGALARVRLHQHASLPDPQLKTAMDWSMDLPVMVGQQQTLLHLQIHRDEHADALAPAARGWQMRFAMNTADMGEVGAQVSLRGGATGVMLWASDGDSAARLETYIGALRQTLADVGLRPGAVIVRHGEPPATGQAGSGHVVDATR